MCDIYNMRHEACTPDSQCFTGTGQRIKQHNTSMLKRQQPSVFCNHILGIILYVAHAISGYYRPALAF